MITNLNTPNKTKTLKEQAISSGIVTILSQFFKFTITTLSTVLLGRLLTPEDYGLVGMVSVIINFIILFKDIGFSTAIIQRQEITQVQVSTLYWINFCFSLLITLITIIISPLVSKFYSDSRLELICIVLALSFFISGLSVIHQSLLKRAMLFNKIAQIEIISVSIGVVSAIVLAIFSFGYWSLVLMQVITSIVNTILTFVYAKWKPDFRIKIDQELIKMVKFGGNITGFNLLNYFSRNADNIIIGRFMGAIQLGFYSRAYNLFMLPINQINGPVSSVAIPTLSKLTNEPQRYRKAYIKIIELLSLFTIPLILFLMLSSYEIIYIFLGEQWVNAAKVFTFLSILGLVQPISNSTGWLFATQDRTNDQLKWGYVSSLLTILSFIAGIPFGIEGVAASYAVSGILIRMPLLLYWVGRKGPIKTIDFYKVLFPKALCGMLVYIIMFFFLQLKFYIELPVLMKIVVSLFGTFVLFLSFLFVLPGSKGSVENIKLLLHFIIRKFKKERVKKVDKL